MLTSLSLRLKTSLSLLQNSVAPEDNKYALTLFFTLVLPLCTYLTRGSQNTQSERELLLSYSGKRRQALVRHVKKQANIIINTLRNHPCHCGRAIVYTSVHQYTNERD